MPIKLPIETYNPLFGKYLYPEAKELMEAQQHVSWTAQEIPVEDDKHDYLVAMSPSQTRLTTTTLQLFVEIEQEVGEVWERIASWYPHSEIDGACIEIARMEKSVHAFFYQKMSDVLNIDPAETLEQQQTIKVLKDKLTLLKSITASLDENKPLSLFTVGAIEQVLLFSNFAMLKSFKANGNNLIKKTLTGVDYVIQDEQLHGDFATYLHNIVVDESKKLGVFNTDHHRKDCIRVIQEIVEHEDAVIDYVYEGTVSINDITPEQLKVFIRSRANIILVSNGFEEMYTDLPDNSIARWFYKGINSIKSHDFFSANTTQYSRTWKFDNFSRLPHRIKKDTHESISTTPK